MKLQVVLICVLNFVHVRLALNGHLNIDLATRTREAEHHLLNTLLLLDGTAFALYELKLSLILLLFLTSVAVPVQLIGTVPIFLVDQLHVD